MGEIVQFSDAEIAEVQEHLAVEARFTKAVAESKALNWPALESADMPQRDWAIDGWLGMGFTTLLAGPGGSGKTALMQTVLSALSLGHAVIDEVAKPRRCMMWFGEDDADEIWRRQIAIAEWLQVPLSAFKDRFYAICRPTDDITLAGMADGRLVPTTELAVLEEQIGDLKIEVCSVDSIARTYGGNENDRHQVTQYVSWLTAAGRPTRCAMVPIGHPAKAEGSEFSGSTAWEASVRARLYFGHRMPGSKDDPDNPPDPASVVRYLAKRKTNYSVQDFRIVRYLNGAMIPQLPDPSIPAGGRSLDFLADEALHLIRRLKVMGIDASHAPNSPNYLPKAAQGAGVLPESLTVGDIKKGLGQLLKTSRIHIGNVGQYPNRTPKKGLVEPQP